ncbi:MAG: hypothetical protein AB7O74_13670 [Candidatus Nanopelagicales bacterium]
MSQTPDDPADTQIPASEHEDEGRYDAGDPHRRRSAHLYGLIVSGAVLATAPESFRISRVAFMLVATLAIYWIAETYVHWIATRTIHGRDLTGPERRRIIKDGWPLMAACIVPVVVLLGEAVLQLETAVAVKVALIVNTLLLGAVGWNMGRAGGLRGARLVASSVMTALLGVVMIVLKTTLH